MSIIVQIIHLLVAVSLISFVLLQSSKGGLGSAFGGGEVYRTRRGAERVVLTATIATTILFFATSIITLFVR